MKASLTGGVTAQTSSAPASMLEVHFIGRGGQGVVSAAQLLAEAAVLEGKYVQAFPEFGAERSGAPISAYARVSQEPIEIHSLIHSPGVIVVVDKSLLRSGWVSSGLTGDGIFLCNYDGPLAGLRPLLGLPERASLFGVPASEISLKTIGKEIPNTPTLGALVKVTEAVSLDSVGAVLARRFKASLQEENMSALRMGYEQVAGPG